MRHSGNTYHAMKLNRKCLSYHPGLHKERYMIYQLYIKKYSIAHQDEYEYDPLQVLRRVFFLLEKRKSE